MKNNHEISYIKEMCESLSSEFNEKKFKNEVKAFSNFLYSCTTGYNYNRSYLEEQSIQYINYRKKVIQHRDSYNKFKSELYAIKKQLEDINKENKKISFILNGIFNIDFPFKENIISEDRLWDISDIYEKAKTRYFNDNLTTISIMIVLSFNNKIVRCYDYKYDYDSNDMKSIILALYNELKKLLGELKNEQ